ncbi:hypothetical protein TBLA_0H00840 [Henningerozyma blattae CBS 6284]|uniref:Uncharacterized protein n=1 Tax=Henningerozyma blattae (strain ATCC 34711 / CBS 6284 / DSM 70876 / NBRC 10599 / NRRL Y-10934 / UCD 77-7) TaxID=1071380 RepID=I2H7M1_HENB6|nr:hypothetical protein TBLA_0H00840 [Tetrapisispora blattae CBS 6284]CCH62373.1 hypothetical protein TBLA_0H00840 [Tetrapisispora blattae CBS 6284]
MYPDLELELSHSDRDADVRRSPEENNHFYEILYEVSKVVCPWRLTRICYFGYETTIEETNFIFEIIQESWFHILVLFNLLTLYVVLYILFLALMFHYDGYEISGLFPLPMIVFFLMLLSTIICSFISFYRVFHPDDKELEEEEREEDETYQQDVNYSNGFDSLILDGSKYLKGIYIQLAFLCLYFWSLINSVFTGWSLIQFYKFVFNEKLEIFQTIFLYVLLLFTGFSFIALHFTYIHNCSIAEIKKLYNSLINCINHN